MAHELDRALEMRELAPLDDGRRRFRVELTSEWTIFGKAHGGYLASLCTEAIRRVLPHPDPFNLSILYSSLCELDRDAVIAVEVIRVGRGHSSAVARLLQDEKECVRTTAVFGDLDRRRGDTFVEGAAPDLPAVETCDPGALPPPPSSTLLERVQILYPPGFWDGFPNGRGRIEGWIQFRDGRAPDVLSLPLFVDAFPPPAFQLVGPKAWVPTIQLDVQIRKRPAAGWLRCSFSTRFVTDGYLEEDGEV